MSTMSTTFNGSNPTFKQPTDTAALPGRSPTPPTRHIEPLSPPKPAPIEPNFNYPAINNHVDFTVRPEQAYGATPKIRNRSSSYRSGHHRTPSTIDTLAEAALAVSPHYAQPQSRIPSGNTFAFPAPPTSHDRSEPPHKRARSEILPAHLVSQYASRPLTSYDGFGGGYGGSRQYTQTGDYSDESRIEAASLLLNFRTGGLPNITSNGYQQPLTNAPAASRPHANSFPQDVYQPRPAELASQAGLLPPFGAHGTTHAYSSLPSPQQTIIESDAIPQPATGVLQIEQSVPVDLAAVAPPVSDVEMKDVPTHGEPAPEHSVLRATSVSEASETTAKPKRTGSKAKSRTTSRRSLAEKSVTKRAAARKKTPDSKASRTTSVAPDVPVILPRRKSFSNVPGVSSSMQEDIRAESRAKSVPPSIPMVIHPAPKIPKRLQKVATDIVCAGCATTRETAKLGGEMDEWISCNGCKKWFHVDCAGFKRATEVRDVDKFFCGPCEPTHGKTTYVRKSTRAHASVDYAELQRGVLKTSEESMEHHYIQPIKDGTFQFDPEYFPRMRPELVTKEFLERSNTFIEPICIPAEWNPRPWLKRPEGEPKTTDTEHHDMHDSDMNDLNPEEYEYDVEQDVGQDKLGMVMPEDLTVRQVCNLAGPDTPLDVIDVKTQNSGAKWTLSRWADYYEEEGDDKPIRNVISLEVSLTRLGRLLRRPQVVRDIDLQDQVWPQKEIDMGKYPKVQFYCLMSVADSYTDFHIDFGGSSVYYHILKGKKTFFFIPPKAKHLKAYEEWNDSPQQNYTFLPSITKECYRVDLSEGDTMLIPSGWIHAVWTPETSLVIGGNFLTRMSYKNQFKVVDIEKANNTPMKFRYPFFQKIMWYTTIQYLETDPLPESVKQLFYDGKQFERQRPVWADYDGELLDRASQNSSSNVRYYSQAEIDGLPDLVTYIFHTVMLVMGRIDGISADRIKRINASIPKGHGEPLELAKTFALWVAWKRGNEHPPAWAHPDAVLPNKDEGPPKKLSARALKELERKEAIAAWRVAGANRESARVKNATAANVMTNVDRPSTPDRTPISSYPSQQQPSNPPPPSDIDMAHQVAHQHDVASVQPMSTMMNSLPTQYYYSTPKSSVLGPKRVACDACRRRRIRCKHKDLVMQATYEDLPSTSPNGMANTFSSDMHDNITVTPPQKPSSQITTNDIDQQRALQQGSMSSGSYPQSHVPLSINGATLDGAPKRGRSKACFECRKSKRRCIHDENGNVDPIKAAENPIPRGSVPSKKRSLPNDNQTPVKKPKPSPSLPDSNRPADFAQAALPNARPPPHSANNHHQAIHPPSPPSEQATHHAPKEAPQHHHSQQQPPSDQQHVQQQMDYSRPQIDPSLYAPPAMHTGPYHNHYHQYSQPGYPFQSLEQIANDVLDFDPPDDVPLKNGQPDADATRPDESVDSAISLPSSDDGKQKDEPAMTFSSRPTSRDDTKMTNGHHDAPELPQMTSAQPSNADSLPLYKPPMPLPRSPEMSKHRPIGNVDAAGPEDGQSMELAKALQQDDLGLRRRSK